MKEQDEFLTALGARLKAARVNRNNMSQRELAELAGTAKGSISSYELGASEAGIKSLTKIADILNVSVSWLISGNEIIDVGTDSEKAAKIREYIHFLNTKITL